MIQKNISPTELKPVQVAPPQVWLRRNIARETFETASGEGVRAYDAWTADEVTFIDPAVTESYANEHFDELWEAHEKDDMTDAEKIADLAQQVADANAALLELGDLIGGE